jgi:hypothetical protein
MSYHAISWYVNPDFDVPSLKSPQPCVHGAGCAYMVKDADGGVKPGCCHYVHPGEEGNGRRLFPAKDGKPACVRLTGNASFYERCRLKMSWMDWCKQEDIYYVPNKVGERHEPVKLFPIGKVKQNAVALRTELRSVFERLRMLVRASSLPTELKKGTEFDMGDYLNDVEIIIRTVEASVDP